MSEINQRTDPQNYNIRVLDKCLDMLEMMARHPAGISLADLSRQMKLPKSSVFRYLVTFENHGYVERSKAGDQYHLGIKFFELGQVVHLNLDIREVALPFMEELLAKFGETVNLAVLDNNEIVYIEILESQQALRMAAKVGSRDKLHSTALGKSLLAFVDQEVAETILPNIDFVRRTEHSIMDAESLLHELEHIKQCGYALDLMENEPGVCCAGAPILNYQGEPVAAISISGPMYRISEERLNQIGVEISKLTRLISKKIGYL